MICHWIGVGTDLVLGLVAMVTLVLYVGSSQGLERRV